MENWIRLNYKNTKTGEEYIFSALNKFLLEPPFGDSELDYENYLTFDFTLYDRGTVDTIIISVPYSDVLKNKIDKDKIKVYLT